MNDVRVPREITLEDIYAKAASFSPSMYRRVIIPTSSVKRVGDLLNAKRSFDKGVEPGSMWYMRRSSHHLIRTKALQDDSCLLYPKGNAITPINPKVFHDPSLREGDILISKDSNVGECAIIDGGGWKNHMFSGGVVRLNPSCDRYYFFSFLKQPLFKAQLLSVPRGATITHAKTLWLNCLIPFPDQKDSDRVIHYVSTLMEAIVEKEKMIRDKNRRIDKMIELELAQCQKRTTFIYALPSINEIRTLNRLDSSMYVDDFKQKMFLITNYKYGCATYEELDFAIGRGQNLQI